MQNQPKKVIGIGVAVLDQVLLWEDMSKPVFGNRVLSQQLQGGGMVGTAMTAVARLGGRAEIWASVGSDLVGQRIIDDLAREGVDTSQVRRIEGQTGPTVIACVDEPTGERTFTGGVGWGHLHQTDLGDPARLAQAACILIDGHHHGSALRAARECRRRGVPVVADFGHPVNEKLRELLPYIDHAIVSESCAQSISDDARQACEGIQQLGPRHVCVTLGDRGLASLHGERFRRLSAFEVDVIDTTGAGDVFHGAFCYGLAEGLCLERNLVFASAAAALKCRALGGRAGIPTRGEVDAFLAERGTSAASGDQA